MFSQTTIPLIRVECVPAIPCEHKECPALRAHTAIGSLDADEVLHALLDDLLVAAVAGGVAVGEEGQQREGARAGRVVVAAAGAVADVLLAVGRELVAAPRAVLALVARGNRVRFHW